MWQQPLNIPKCDHLDTVAEAFDWAVKECLVMMMFRAVFVQR